LKLLLDGERQAPGAPPAPQSARAAIDNNRDGKPLLHSCLPLPLLRRY